jgi:hypothetical protein
MGDAEALGSIQQRKCLLDLTVIAASMPRDRYTSPSASLSVAATTAPQRSRHRE